MDILKNKHIRAEIETIIQNMITMIKAGKFDDLIKVYYSDKKIAQATIKDRLKRNSKKYIEFLNAILKNKMWVDADVSIMATAGREITDMGEHDCLSFEKKNNIFEIEVLPEVESFKKNKRESWRRSGKVINGLDEMVVNAIARLGFEMREPSSAVNCAEILTKYINWSGKTLRNTSSFDISLPIQFLDKPIPINPKDYKIKKCSDKQLFQIAVMDGGNWLVLIDNNDSYSENPYIFRIDHNDPGQELEDLGFLSSFIMRCSNE